MPLRADLTIATVNRLPLCAAEFPDYAPRGGFMFYVSKSTIDHVRHNGPRWKYRCLRFVEQVLENPHALFLGLKRDGYDDGLCYTGTPVGLPEALGKEAEEVMQTNWLLPGFPSWTLANEHRWPPAHSLPSAPPAATASLHFLKIVVLVHAHVWGLGQSGGPFNHAWAHRSRPGCRDSGCRRVR